MLLMMLACAICHGFASKVNRILGPNNTIATSSRGRKYRLTLVILGALILLLSSNMGNL